MNRRDAIIVAVLLNAGLLIFMFTVSLKTENVSIDKPSSAFTQDILPFDKESAPIQSESGYAQEGAASSKPQNIDDVELAVKQFATPSQPVQSENSEDPFVLDLQEIGKPAAQEPSQNGGQSGSLASGYKEISVKKGDVLERIARLHNVRVDEIMKLNKLSNANLKIGQVLKIPSKSTKKAIDNEGTLELGGPVYYTVKAGDSPWTIAVKNNLKVEELLKLNRLDAEKARHLKPGDKLRIK